jgi:hypothetical protein
VEQISFLPSWPARYGIGSPFSGLVYCSIVTGTQHLQLRVADSVLDLLTSVMRDNGHGFQDGFLHLSLILACSLWNPFSVQWPRLLLSRHWNAASPTESCGQRLGPAHFSGERQWMGLSGPDAFAQVSAGYQISP